MTDPFSTGSSGLYDLIGAPTPFVSWTIANPDASTNTYNRLTVTETRGTDTRIYSYSYDNNGTWTIDYPGSLREDVVSTVIVTNSDGTYTRTNTTTIRVPGGSDQFKLQRVYYQPYPLPGEPIYGASELLIQETLNPDSAPQTTSYTYDTANPGSGTFQPLRTVVHPDGSWEYYEYLFDYPGDPAGFNTANVPLGNNRLIRIHHGVGDSPVPSDPPPESTSRQIWYDYNPLTSSGDNGLLQPYSPRKISEYVQDQLVALTYVIVLTGEVHTIRCQRTDANWSDADNLVAITKYFTNGPNLGRVSSVQNPDGTMSFYTYIQATDGSQTNTVSTGAPNTGGTAIIDGTTDLTILGPVGQLISHTVIDILSGIVLTQDAYSNYDTLNRPQQVTHLDGTTEFTHYDCCGIDYAIDRDGVTNYLGYDAIKRPITNTRLGITTTSVLDAPGRTVATVRTGTDNSQIPLSQSAYDLAGRLTAQTNALGGITTFAESHDPTTGGLIRTTTNPDGSTRIEDYYLDGTLKSVTGTAVHPTTYSSGADEVAGDDTNGIFTLEAKVAPDGSTNEWVKTIMNVVGQPATTLYSDGSFSQSFYNGQGQLSEEIDPDGVHTLYQYNAKGELAYTALDTNQDNTISWAGNDRITATVSDVTTDNGANVRRSRTWVWATLGANSSNLVSVAETSVDGLRSWQTVYRDASTPVTSFSQTVFAGGGYRYATNIAPDSSYTVSVYLNGQLVSVTRKDSANNQIASTSYGYDAHGRQNTVTDARNGTSTTTFNNADLVASVTTPVPGSLGSAPETTLTYYNNMLQATSVVNPDGTTTTTEYWLTGEVKRNYGARTYPVGYGYDYAGRLSTMTNWSSFSGGTGARVTAWNYDQYRGWL
ncbi:MAG TPA: hypothetical protein VG167_05750, partial [Verrucomicrobiae bacterium]|nr:hypothetical protein [Verrucomicrobiae bacterium]